MADEQYYRFLNANAVKIIAIIAMTLDHLAFVIYRNDPNNTVAVLLLYNGQRGKSPWVNRFWQGVFYVYYPLHLVVIGCLACCGVLA